MTVVYDLFQSLFVDPDRSSPLLDAGDVLLNNLVRAGVYLLRFSILHETYHTEEIAKTSYNRHAFSASSSLLSDLLRSLAAKFSTLVNSWNHLGHKLSWCLRASDWDKSITQIAFGLWKFRASISRETYIWKSCPYCVCDCPPLFSGSLFLRCVCYFSIYSDYSRFRYSVSLIRFYHH